MPARRTWADEILDRYDFGLDLAQIDERLALTPEQRLDRLQSFTDFLAALNADAPPVQPPARRPPRRPPRRRR